MPDNPDICSDPERYSAFVTYAKFMSIEDYMSLRHDPGAYICTHSEDARRSFLTPTLRELNWTALSDVSAHGTF